jgi:hypothetical protein
MTGELQGSGVLGTEPTGAEENGVAGSFDAAVFDVRAGEALATMKREAERIGIAGVAAVAYAEDGEMQSWRSRMLVAGRRASKPQTGDIGMNFLSVVYSKMAEMADTLRDSGSGVRPPLKGEFGWPGGLIARAGHGYALAAFSGGKGEEDLVVARLGLETLIRAF